MEVRVREGPCGRVGEEDVGGGNDAVEAVALGYFPAAVAVPAEDEDGAVFQLLSLLPTVALGVEIGERGIVVDVGGEGRVALHEHPLIYLRSQQFLQFGHAGGFGLSAAVCEEDVGDSEIVQQAEGLWS